MTDRKRIAIFEPYVFDTMYGNHRYILALFRHLDRSRYEPILLAPRETAFLGEVRAIGARTVIVPAPAALQAFGDTLLRGGPRGKIVAAVNAVRYAAKLASAFRRKRIDLVQCHSLRALLLAGPAARLTRTRALWYVKGHLDNPLLDRAGFALADRILFQSEANMRRRYPRLVARHRAKVGLLPNGLDLAEIRESETRDRARLRTALGLSLDRVNICFVGCLTPLKGIAYLLKAMAAVQAEVADTALYLVGDHGAEEYAGYAASLKKMADELGLTRVTFTGWRADAREILAETDIFVLPSLSEGMPRSIMEAMALAKPVVATRVGGVEDLVAEGETGFVVEPRDAAGLAGTILRLVRDPELRQRLGAAGREVAWRDLGIERNIRGLEEAYGALLGVGNGAGAPLNGSKESASTRGWARR